MTAEGRVGGGATVSPAPYARVAGAAYLLVIGLGVLVASVVDGPLVVPNDPAATAANVADHEGLFRLGVVTTLVLYVSVLVLSWALYVVVRPVHRALALLALILRCAEGVLGCATTLPAFVLLAALRSESAVDPEAVAILLEARVAAMDIVLVLVGLGGALFCLLLFTSRLVPRALSTWGVLTYASMLVLSLLSMLWPAHPVMLETVLYGAGTLFEVAFGLWLLIKAVDGDRWRARA